jgi:hypothetical protein
MAERCDRKGAEEVVAPTTARLRPSAKAALFGATPGASRAIELDDEELSRWLDTRARALPEEEPHGPRNRERPLRLMRGRSARRRDALATRGKQQW